MESPTTEKLIKLATDHNVLAFGETGLDYFRSTRDECVTQKESFIAHIEAACETKLPLVIHARDSFQDIFQILKNYRSRNLCGVMHCFTGTLDEAKQALDLGFMISFSGIITFKNAKELQLVATEIPLDYILIETDSPYLAPVPYRGKCNEPAFVKYVAEQLAMLKDISFNEVARATTNNFKNLFKL